MWNLVANAVKFTPREGRVTVWLRAGDGTAEIGVRDTGQGIAAGRDLHGRATAGDGELKPRD